MIYVVASPPKPLIPFIESFSYWEGTEPSSVLNMKTACSTPSMQINLYSDKLRWYRNDDGEGCRELSGVTMAGPQTRPFAVEHWQPRFVRVVFRPGGVFPFWRTSVSTVENDLISLEDAWGNSVRILRGRLIETETSNEIFTILGDYLLSRLSLPDAARISPIRHAVAFCERAARLPTVSELARRANQSEKHFIHQFTKAVGVTPKVHLRLTRFKHLYAAITSTRRVDWAAEAVDHGYFDQPHLIRDFKQFAGGTPGDYYSRFSFRKD